MRRSGRSECRQVPNAAGFMRVLIFAATVALILMMGTPSSMARLKEGKVISFKDKKSRTISLPDPVHRGKMPLEEAIAKRESVRNFNATPLKDTEISQLLWAAQGITRSWGGRASPSAGALYPLEIYLVLEDGLFHYNPRHHQLLRLSEEDLRGILASAALGQNCVRNAPATVVISAVFERIERKYGNRGERYVKIEVGHAAQNVLLQAVSLGLGAVPIGAFQDDRVQKALRLPADHVPLYLIPVGHEKR